MSPPKKKSVESLDDLFDSNVSEHRAIFPTGIAVLDPELGGGLREGTTIEAYGPPASGKTSVGYSTIGQIQKLELGMSVLFDCEGSWNPDMGARLGIDVDHTMPDGNLSFRVSSHPDIKIVEELFDRIKQILYGFPNVRFIMVDSLAALVPRALTTKKKDDQVTTTAMQRANLLATYMNELDRWIRETGSKTAVYFVNHEKEEIGFSGHGPAKTNTPGGLAGKYLASMRLEFRLATQDWVEVVDPVTGQKTRRKGKQYIRVTATKNRFYPPHRPSTFIFDLGKGIDSAYTAVLHAKAQKVFVVAGSWLTLPGEFTGGEPVKKQSVDLMATYLEENPDVLSRLEEHVGQNLRLSTEQVVPPEVVEPTMAGVTDITNIKTGD